MSDNKTINIITDFNEKLGNGHIQRMLSLCTYLNEFTENRAFIINKKRIKGFEKYFLDEITTDVNLIIRDLRDSTESEAGKLKKIAKLVVIDDNGTGKKYADKSINLLPNLNTPFQDFDFNRFILGYNFLFSLKNLKEKQIEKEYDLAVYAGTDLKTFSFLKKILPKDLKVVVLAGKKSYGINIKKEALEEETYSKLILKSKFLLTHFGITMFEGFFSSCNLIALNPSNYHNKLTKIIEKKFDINNLGVLDTSLEETYINLFNSLREINPKKDKIYPQKLYLQGLNFIENFFMLIK